MNNAANTEAAALQKLLQYVTRGAAAVADRLRAELPQVDATDYAALMAKQQEIAAAEEEVSQLETEWLELSDRLGIG